ncbi:CPBP family intramembrane glutamic endopeptidase [Deinococcus navajonensis]|uniref:CPBP family intramembrane glutamic endopeptidase n=1 Tax=Deinococcus navajonensis TaxID=309884 RepID=A0ABV8XSH8_9DEIO
MTVPDAPTPSTPDWSSAGPVAPVPGHAEAPRPGVRAVDGNRAALALLLVQNIVSGVLIARHTPLGLSLLASVAANVLVGWLLFRPALRALVQDSRWRTPPSWGLALGTFVLAFLASRAAILFFVTLFPETADSVPQFLSRGPDLWLLLLAAGLLVPFLEEVAFRGLMMRGHERAAGFTLAALSATFAFSVAHGVPASIVGILPLAYALARVVQHSGSLWNSVIIHALNNTLAVGLGALISGSSLEKSLGNPAQAGDLLGNPALRWPLAGGALLFGGVVLFVIHLWLTPRPDLQVAPRARAPWISGAYVAVVLFGLVAALVALPAVQAALTSLRGALP